MRRVLAPQLMPVIAPPTVEREAQAAAARP